MSEPQMTAEQAIEILEGCSEPEFSEAVMLEMRDQCLPAIANFIRALAARNAELESAARWRSCETEPPENLQSLVLVRWKANRWAPEVMHGEDWMPGGRCSSAPDEWRPIT